MSLFKTSRDRCPRDAQSPPVSLSTVSVSPPLQKSGASFTLCQTDSSLKSSKALLDYDLLSHFLCSGARWNKASHFVQEWFSYSGSLCSYLSELGQIGNVPSTRASYWKTRQLSDCVEHFFFLHQEQSASESAIQTFHTDSVWKK